MPTLLRLFYVSVAAPSVDRQAVDDILAVSRINNYRSDLTGCLLFTGRHFAQLLEGREEVVEAAVTRIATDPRHSQVRTLDRSRSKLRLYNDWRMGYLHDLALEDEIQRLGAMGSPEQHDVDAVLFRMRPDSLLGPLT